MNTYSLLNAGRVNAGPGSIDSLKEVVADFNAKNILIISDKGVAGAGLISRPQALLEETGASVSIIDDTPPEPSVEQVESILFVANGAYKGGVARNRFDGFYRFKFNAWILNVQIFNGDPGLSGTTEVECYRFTSAGGSGTSIFSTTPKIDSTAAANVWAGIGESVAGVTAPILTSSPNMLAVNAGDVLQAKIISVMGGNPKDLQLQIDWLPRVTSI